MIMKVNHEYYIVDIHSYCYWLARTEEDDKKEWEIKNQQRS